MRGGWGKFGVADGKRAAVQGMRDQGGGRYSCLYLAFLKNEWWKTNLAEGRCFWFFETKIGLIGRNKFIALMYSRELLSTDCMRAWFSLACKRWELPPKCQCSAMAVEHLLNVSQAEFPNLLYGLWWRNIRGQEVSPATFKFTDKSWHRW